MITEERVYGPQNIEKERMRNNFYIFIIKLINRKIQI